ncbi:hypothetical protein FOA43_002777 [Brettanomyces nanus]|uniref:Uncharacterized protein n=1 Tax=Eeniella nana TaxID=13502 RepID=A0A875S3F4_EENNA|nr:uncharacterized protein FOA43_002777 [Brettanomyces nanus]QPG75423.1 hypothetical protein FOA43_002777 [Brettanomyces nanus]
MANSDIKDFPPRRHVPPPAHLSEFYHYVDGPGHSKPQVGAASQVGTAGAVAVTDSIDGVKAVKLSDHSTSSSADGQSPDISTPVLPVSPISDISKHMNSHTIGASSITSSRLLRYTLSHTESYQSSTAPSALDLETLITGKDIKDTIDCYKTLINTSQKYREALAQLNLAASEFGGALETCARLKGSGEASEGLMGCSGLQYMIANQQQILVRNLEVDFQNPVVGIIDEFEQQHLNTDAEFKKLINDKVRQLKKNEKTNIKLSRKKYRNIAAYRSNLQQLTAQLDEIDRLKHDYYMSSYEQVQCASRSILDRTRDIVSLETTIYDSVAKKGETGGGLDNLLEEESDARQETEFNDDEADSTLKTDNDHEETPKDASNEIFASTSTASPSAEQKHSSLIEDGEMNSDKEIEENESSPHDDPHYTSTGARFTEHLDNQNSNEEPLRDTTNTTGIDRSISPDKSKTSI